LLFATNVATNQSEQGDGGDSRNQRGERAMFNRRPILRAIWLIPAAARMVRYYAYSLRDDWPSRM